MYNINVYICNTQLEVILITLKLKIMKATAQQLERVTRDLQAIAKENLTVELIAGCIYAFGSELACLRLEHKYNNRAKSYCDFSKPRNSYFFVITD